MIRAGVDDRAMLSTTGVNVRLLFVGVFAIGGFLAGLSGVIGGSALRVAPGEDVRYLLASLVVVIVGGMGSIIGAAIGALSDRSRRAARPRLLPDLWRRADLRHHGRDARAPAAGDHGQRADAPRRSPNGLPPRPTRAQPSSTPATAALGVALRAGFPLVANALRRVPDRRPDADSGHDRAVADGARRLRRHGLWPS